jgi:hypothetical protein
VRQQADECTGLGRNAAMFAAAIALVLTLLK